MAKTPVTQIPVPTLEQAIGALCGEAKIQSASTSNLCMRIARTDWLLREGSRQNGYIDAPH